MVLPDIGVIDGRSGPIDLFTAMAAIDRALAAGLQRNQLRWRVSPEQRTAMIQYAISVMDPRDCTATIRDFPNVESGIFCGIPFVVDRGSSPQSIALEMVTAQKIGEIGNLSIPYSYSK